ncbi:MAG: molybdenum cofactor biosynthesis protein MoaE, partial [Octadecabacter sp.]
MIRVLAMPFDPGGEFNTFSASVAGAGAIVSFTGVVRDVAGSLSGMEIEHYPGMTEKALGAIR